MSTESRSIARKVLAYLMMIILITAVYIATAFVVEQIFAWLGDEDGVRWESALLGCIFTTAAITIIDIVRDRKNRSDKSQEIIKGCRQIFTFATTVFAGFVFLEWWTECDSSTGAAFVFDTERWLSLALAMGIGSYIYQRREQRAVESDENRLMVVAECEDMERAKELSTTLERSGINTMIVEKSSPIYIKGSDAPIQIQTLNKDCKAAKELLSKDSN